MSSKQKLQTKHKIPVITVGTANMTGAQGAVIETTCSVSGDNPILSLRDGDQFTVTVAGKIRVIDASVARTVVDYVEAVDAIGNQAIPVKITAVITAGAGLPAITLSALNAIDYQTIEAIHTTNAAYADYYIAIDLDFGNPKKLSVAHRISVAVPGETYDCAVAGATAGLALGPWSNVLSVAVPDQPGTIDPGVPAKMADAFNRSMGQNGLFVFQNASSPFGPTYWTAAQTGAPTGVRGLLAGLGCVSWRGGISTAAHVKTMYQYLSGLGHKFCVLVNPTTATGPDVSQIPSQLSLIKNIFGSTNLATKLICVEGMNEVNNMQAWGAGQTLAAIAQKSHDFQAQLYAAVRADPAFANVPCLSFSDWGRSAKFMDAQLAYNPRGQRDISDGKPFHGYNSGHKPSVFAFPNDETETGGAGEQPIVDAMFECRRSVLQQLPAYTTEVGYIHWQTAHTTQCSAAETGATPSPFFVTELCKAKYISREYLEHWRVGVPFTFNFMILNNWNQRPFYGMLNQNKYIGGGGVAASPNANTGPPYNYLDTTYYQTIKRIHAILADPGVDFTPTNLDYHFTGAAVTQDLHHALLQKRNGEFYLLAAWDYLESYKRSAPIGEVADGTLKCDCTLQFDGGANVASVTRYEPVYGTTTLVGTNIASAAVRVKDSLMIWKITP